MVKKIISGGQTGVDRAALDFAIKFDVPHGGWIVKGRWAEDGVLPEKYMLQEIQESSYPRRTLKNVIESDGTLLISKGDLNGGSEYTRKMAISRGRPHLHIDLKRMSHFQSAEKIREWIGLEKIEILNVAGPRGSKDPKIYDAVLDILETAFFLEIIDSNTPQGPGSPYETSFREKKPESVNQAVEVIISGLSFSDRTKIANMSAENLQKISENFGEEIISRFQLREKNSKLMTSCRKEGGDEVDDERAAVKIIIERLAEKLRQKRNILKVVKN